MTKKLSDRVSKWSVLPTASFHGKILQLQESGEKIIDLTVGISNLPIPKSGEKAAINSIKTNNVPYTAITGTAELKGAIQKKLAGENKIKVDTSNIIVTTGAKQAIFQALYSITNPGDEILLFSPNWPAYTQMASMLKLTPKFLPLDQISSLGKMSVGPKAKVFILNNPHNPTGKIFTKQELQEVGSFIRKNNLWCLSDESYEKLNYQENHLSFQTVNPDLKSRIITTFSVSQSFSMMGWRLGYAVADKEIIEAMEAIQSSITAGTSAVTQTAVANIINTEEDYVKKLTAEFKKRRDLVYPKLSSIPWMKCDLPDSGPYFWCDITSLTKNSLEFTSKLLQKQKVALMPGEAFGAPGWIRIAFNVAPVQILEEAIKRIVKFEKDYDN